MRKLMMVALLVAASAVVVTVVVKMSAPAEDGALTREKEREDQFNKELQKQIDALQGKSPKTP